MPSTGGLPLRVRLRALATVWAVAFACFAALALLFTSQVWIDFGYAGRRLTWGHAFLVALVDWELWAIVTPAIVWLAGRVPFSRRRWGVALAVHLPVSVATGGAKLVLENILTRTVLGLGQGRLPFSFLKVDLTLLTYWAIVATAHVVRHYRDARARELRAAQLETALARAQVEALKMQLHPHFLFNTLNTIAGLMREDVEAADAMLARLAELLRRTFETADIQDVPLARELEFLDAYLDIQRTRYGERLRLSVDASEEARRARVPTLILQPLVENAIRHGIAERPGPGRVDIEARVERRPGTGEARRRDGRLVIRIVNDGPELPPTIRDGYGLRNIRSRLQTLYGPRGSFFLTPRPGGGAVAVLDIPLMVDEPTREGDGPPRLADDGVRDDAVT